jgi:hypothetical protein
LKRNHDAKGYELALKVLDGKYAGLETGIIT